MKVQKLNKELLNLYYKKDKLGHPTVYAQLVHDYVYVSDTYRVWKLKYNDFMLDINKLKTIDLAHLFNEDGYIPGYKTNRLIERKDGITGIYLTSEEEDFEVLINKKYLDIFENYTLKIKGEFNLVLVYENDELVGLLMPMRNLK